MKKTLTTLTILATLLLGSFAVAQSSWIGTDWIQAGNTVSSVNLKSNLDYLYNEKAPIPQDCNGITEFLGWFNGGWTCQETNSPNSCIFAGDTITSGGSVTAYLSSNPSFGESCVSEVRTCSNGTLSGSYQAPSCSVAAASSCVLNGSVIQHGDTITAYESTTVGAGSACASEVRTCSNGTLSGSYQNTTCTVAPTACVFGGVELALGDSVTAYQASSVPHGSACSSQERTCEIAGSAPTCQQAEWEFDGAVSQQNPSSQCANHNLTAELCNAAGVPVAECAISNFQTIADTGAYCSAWATVCSTTAPQSQTENYALTGFYQHPTCVVEPPVTSNFTASDFFVEQDTNNSGFFAGLFSQTQYVFIGDWGISSNRADGQNGDIQTPAAGGAESYRDLAVDQATLNSLCQLVGFAGASNVSGTSPANNTNLLYSASGDTWMSLNTTRSGSRLGSGTITCTNNPVDGTTPSTPATNDTQSGSGNNTAPNGGGGIFEGISNLMNAW